jgi:peroxiredoxin Q/BCP
MAALQEGLAAPDFELETDSGEQFRLGAHRGKNIVLYFYPKADTPGCTTQACEFRDSSPELAGANAIVLGVSPDTPGKQAKFKQKFGLPFILLSDTEHKVAEDYGVWVEKSMYGRKYMGMERCTFIIDKAGNLAKILRKVKPAGHAKQVLEALQTLE